MRNPLEYALDDTKSCTHGRVIVRLQDVHEEHLLRLISALAAKSLHPTTNPRRAAEEIVAGVPPFAHAT